MHDETREPIDLVTGATGFTGGALALELRRRGRSVRALVRDPGKAGHLAAAGVALVRGDITRPDDVDRAAEGVERIFHLAAIFRTAGHSDEEYRAVNAGGVDNVIAAARRHGVARTIHCSTIGVHGNVKEVPATEETPENPGDIYQKTKLEGEIKAREAFSADVPGVIFRPTGIYGPGDTRFLKLFRPIHRGRFAMVGDGETLYHFSYIDDVVEGIILCGTHPDALGRIYLIGFDEYLTLNELVARIAEILDVHPPRARIPVTPLRVIAHLCERICVPLGIDPPLHRRRVDFFTKNRAFSVEKAKRELGYRPRFSVEEGLRRTARWYFDQGYLSGELPEPLRELGPVPSAAGRAV
jgi:nucleoside-diphosphate-sugar epimerase